MKTTTVRKTASLILHAAVPELVRAKPARKAQSGKKVLSDSEIGSADTGVAQDKFVAASGNPFLSMPCSGRPADPVTSKFRVSPEAKRAAQEAQLAALRSASMAGKARMINDRSAAQRMAKAAPKRAPADSCLPRHRGSVDDLIGQANGRMKEEMQKAIDRLRKQMEKEKTEGVERAIEDLKREFEKERAEMQERTKDIAQQFASV